MNAMVIDSKLNRGDVNMIEFAILTMGLWAYKEVGESTTVDAKLFLIAIVLLIAECFMTRIYEKVVKVNTNFIRISLLLLNVGMLLAYPYGEIVTVFKTVMLSTVAILTGYIFVKTDMYRMKSVEVTAMLAIPVLLVMTRIMGKEINGAYLQIGPIMTLALIIMLLPIACGYCITNEIEGYASSTKSIPVNQLRLLILTMVVAVFAGLVNNEYGTACIVCVTTALLFFIYGRNIVSKLVFSGISIVAMSLALMASTKLKSRLLICFNIDKAMELYPQEAQPVKHIQDLIGFSGLYGVNHGALNQNIIKNVTSDYAISGLLFNTGVIFTAIVVLLLVVFIIQILMMNTSNRYEKVILESIAFILSVMVVFSVGGPLGTFVLSGVGMPFVSTTASINLALFFNVGMVLCMKEGVVRKYV